MGSGSEPGTVGFIDVGTNSVHLLVVRFFEGASGTVVYQDKESVRLGKSVYSTGRMDPESVSRAALVISRFAEISKGLGAESVKAYATCAVREAENRQELAAALSGDVELSVIPGQEEARLIALGVFGHGAPAERTLCMDIGGGSTEVIVREKGENLFLDSLSMGALRFAYGLGVDCSGPVSPQDYGMMLRCVDVASYHAVARVGSLGFSRAVGSSGTMLALASAAAARRGDGDASYFTLAELHDLMSDMLPMTAAERAAAPGMSRSRGDIIVPGGAVAEELMHLLGIERIEVSQSGLKQGMMLDHLHVDGADDPRMSSVLALAHRCMFDRPHAENVRSAAESLFDQSRALGLHSLDDGWRSLLSCAAVLHDVGELISYQNHHVLAQAIIERSDLEGFSEEELHMLGLMVRFHHKRFPGPGDPKLDGLPQPDAEAVRVCAMLLRIAELTDRHRNGAVRSVRMTVEGGCAVLELSADEDPSMELWSMGRLDPDFRRLFGLGLVARSPDAPGRGLRVGRHVQRGAPQSPCQCGRFRENIFLLGPRLHS